MSSTAPAADDVSDGFPVSLVVSATVGEPEPSSASSASSQQKKRPPEAKMEEGAVVAKYVKIADAALVTNCSLWTLCVGCKASCAVCGGSLLPVASKKRAKVIPSPPRYVLARYGRLLHEYILFQNGTLEDVRPAFQRDEWTDSPTKVKQTFAYGLCGNNCYRHYQASRFGVLHRLFDGLFNSLMTFGGQMMAYFYDEIVQQLIASWSITKSQIEAISTKTMKRETDQHTQDAHRKSRQRARESVFTHLIESQCGLTWLEEKIEVRPRLTGDVLWTLKSWNFVERTILAQPLQNAFCNRLCTRYMIDDGHGTQSVHAAVADIGVYIKNHTAMANSSTGEYSEQVSTSLPDPAEEFARVPQSFVSLVLQLAQFGSKISRPPFSRLKPVHKFQMCMLLSQIIRLHPRHRAVPYTLVVRAFTIAFSCCRTDTARLRMLNTIGVSGSNARLLNWMLRFANYYVQHPGVYDKMRVRIRGDSPEAILAHEQFQLAVTALDNMEFRMHTNIGGAHIVHWLAMHAVYFEPKHLGRLCDVQIHANQWVHVLDEFLWKRNTFAHLNDQVAIAFMCQFDRDAWYRGIDPRPVVADNVILLPVVPPPSLCPPLPTIVSMQLHESHSFFVDFSSWQFSRAHDLNVQPAWDIFVQYMIVHKFVVHAECIVNRTRTAEINFSSFMSLERLLKRVPISTVQLPTDVPRCASVTVNVELGYSGSHDDVVAFVEASLAKHALSGKVNFMVADEQIYHYLELAVQTRRRGWENVVPILGGAHTMWNMDDIVCSKYFEILLKFCAAIILPKPHDVDKVLTSSNHRLKRLVIMAVMDAIGSLLVKTFLAEQPAGFKPESMDTVTLVSSFLTWGNNRCKITHEYAGAFHPLWQFFLHDGMAASGMYFSSRLAIPALYMASMIKFFPNYLISSHGKYRIRIPTTLARYASLNEAQRMAYMLTLMRSVHGDMGTGQHPDEFLEFVLIQATKQGLRRSCRTVSSLHQSVATVPGKQLVQYNVREWMQAQGNTDKKELLKREKQYRANAEILTLAVLQDDFIVNKLSRAGEIRSIFQPDEAPSIPRAEKQHMIFGLQIADERKLPWLQHVLGNARLLPQQKRPEFYVTRVPGRGRGLGWPLPYITPLTFVSVSKSRQTTPLLELEIALTARNMPALPSGLPRFNVFFPRMYYEMTGLPRHTGDVKSKVFAALAKRIDSESTSTFRCSREHSARTVRSADVQPTFYVVDQMCYIIVHQSEMLGEVGTWNDLCDRMITHLRQYLCEPGVYGIFVCFDSVDTPPQKVFVQEHRRAVFKKGGPALISGAHVQASDIVGNAQVSAAILAYVFKNRPLRDVFVKRLIERATDVNSEYHIFHGIGRSPNRHRFAMFDARGPRDDDHNARVRLVYEQPAGRVSLRAGAELDAYSTTISEGELKAAIFYAGCDIGRAILKLTQQVVYHASYVYTIVSRDTDVVMAALLSHDSTSMRHVDHLPPRIWCNLTASKRLIDIEQLHQNLNKCLILQLFPEALRIRFTVTLIRSAGGDFVPENGSISAEKFVQCLLNADVIKWIVNGLDQIANDWRTRLSIRTSNQEPAVTVVFGIPWQLTAFFQFSLARSQLKVALHAVNAQFDEACNEITSACLQQLKTEVHAPPYLHDGMEAFCRVVEWDFIYLQYGHWMDLQSTFMDSIGHSHLPYVNIFTPLNTDEAALTVDNIAIRVGLLKQSQSTEIVGRLGIIFPSRLQNGFHFPGIRVPDVGGKESTPLNVYNACNCKSGAKGPNCMVRTAKGALSMKCKCVQSKITCSHFCICHARPPDVTSCLNVDHRGAGNAELEQAEDEEDDQFVAEEKADDDKEEVDDEEEEENDEEEGDEEEESEDVASDDDEDDDEDAEKEQSDDDMEEEESEDSANEDAANIQHIINSYKDV